MADTDKFTDQQIIALTAWGEFRSGAKPGMQTIINVVQNRLHSGVRWWGNGLREICLHPYQFSCWLTNDPNRNLLINIDSKDVDYQIAMGLAQQAIDGTLPDLTDGSDSYYDSRTARPAWAAKLEPWFVMYPHFYYRTV